MPVNRVKVREGRVSPDEILGMLHVHRGEIAEMTESARKSSESLNINLRKAEKNRLHFSLGRTKAQVAQHEVRLNSLEARLKEVDGWMAEFNQ